MFKKKRINSLAQEKKKTEAFFTLLVLGKLSKKTVRFFSSICLHLSKF